MKHVCTIGVSLALASTTWAGFLNARSCYTGKIGFSIVESSDDFEDMCGDGQMEPKMCSTGICGYYEYQDGQCAYAVGFCSHAATVSECEDGIKDGISLEREDATKQQSAQVARRLACCDLSTACTAATMASPKIARKLISGRSPRKLLVRRRLKKGGKSKSKSKKSGGSGGSGGSFAWYWWLVIPGLGIVAVVAIFATIHCLKDKGLLCFKKNKTAPAYTKEHHDASVKIQAYWRGHRQRQQMQHQQMQQQQMQQRVQVRAVAVVPTATTATVIGTPAVPVSVIATPVAPVITAEPAAVNFCSQCGTKNAGGKFCSGCGIAL